MLALKKGVALNLIVHVYSDNKGIHHSFIIEEMNFLSDILKFNKDIKGVILTVKMHWCYFNKEIHACKLTV